MKYTIMHEFDGKIDWYTARDDKGRYVDGSALRTPEEVTKFLQEKKFATKPRVYATIEVE